MDLQAIPQLWCLHSISIIVKNLNFLLIYRCFGQNFSFQIRVAIPLMISHNIEVLSLIAWEDPV